MTQPLDILLIVLNTPWRGGGTFYRALGFGKYLVQLGHEVTLLATSIESKWAFEYDRVDGVEIVLSPSLLTGKMRRGWDPYEALRRVWWLRGKHFDIVHGFESRPTVIYPALAAARSPESRLVLDWCDWFGRGGAIEERPPLIRFVLRPFETFYEEHFRTRAEATTVINTALQKRVVALGVDPDSILWLPNGAEITRIEVLDKAVARARRGLEPHGRYIGHLGHAWPGDADLLRAAFDALRRLDPTSKLVLIGNHKMTQFDDLIAAGSVLNIGYVDEEELNDYLAVCDLHWILQRDTVTNRGRFSMKVHDYMASGRPIISTAVGDLPRLFTSGSLIGSLVDDQPAEIARRTLDLLDSSELQQLYGQNARQLAEAMYDWEIITSRLNQLYLSLVNRDEAGDQPAG